MSDYKNFDSLVNGLKRSIDLSTNTLVVGNIKIGGETNYATFDVSAVTGAKTITVPNAAVSLGDIASTKSDLSAHVGYTNNPHSVTKAQVGLTNVTDDAQVKKIASAVDADIAVFDGTTGALIKDSGTKVADLALVGHNHSGTYEPANSNIQSHISSTSNPHSVTKAQVGLTNVTDDAQLKAADLDTDNTLAANSDSKIASQKAVKAYVASQVGGAIVGAVIYKGVFDASAGDFTAISNPKQGWMYKVSVAGTISSVLFSVGDNLYINKDVVGSPVVADADKIDNTEAADLLRNSMLTSGQIFVGSAGNVAAAVSMSSEASMIASGAVTLSNSAVISKVLTAYSAGAGVISATDSILSGIQKADGNAAAAKSVADAALVASEFSSANVTAKVLGAGYLAASGTVAIGNSLEVAIEKLDGNSAAAASAASTAQGNVDNLVTLSGVAKDATHLGTFTGAIIADSSTVKAALQAVETKIELVDAKNPLERNEVVGFTVPANSSVVVRLAISGETAGRVYPCINDAGAVGSPTGKIYAVGIVQNRTGSAITAGNSCPMLLIGAIATLQSSDAAFTASQDEGAPIYVSATNGAFQLAVPSAANSAVILAGTVKGVGVSSSFQVGNFQIMGVN